MASSVTDALLQLRAKAQLSAISLRERKAAALSQLLQQQQQAGMAQGAGHTPSGPRRKAEGIEDEQQGVIAAEPTESGGAVLRVTLLAAGYVIGPAGSSVRDVSRVTGADVRSWSESWREPPAPGCASIPAPPPRRVRTIVIEGSRRSVVHALHIIASAVDRYVELTDGSYCGKAVDRSFTIDGCTFFYSPPPRAAVPFAASLRAHERVASPQACKSPAVTADKENVGATATAAMALLAPSPSPRRALAPLRGPALGAPPTTPGLGAAAAASSAASSDLAPHTLLEGLATARISGLAAGVAAFPAAGAAAMELDEGPMEGEEAPTPTYRPYRLFDTGTGFGAGGPTLQAEVCGGGNASLFASAYEAATPSIPSPQTDQSLFSAGGLATPSADASTAGLAGSGGAHDSGQHPSYSLQSLATPSLVTDGSLLRAASAGEDALLAATGFPAYSAFAQQATHYQPTLWAAPPAAADSRVVAPAPRQLPLSSLSALSTLAQLPRGGSQGWQPLWHQQQDQQQYHPF